jgi:hypothetical protein
MIRWLLITLLAMMLFSGLLPFLRRFGIGRLPGDFTIKIGQREFFIPLGSTVVLSLAAAALARLL